MIIEDRKWTVHLSGIELGFNSIGLSIVTFLLDNGLSKLVY